MIFVPSKGRPVLLNRFLSTVTEPGVVILDDDDDSDYSKLDLPHNWNLEIFPKGNYCAQMRRAYEVYPDEPWYALLGDDVYPQTKGWDSILAEACMPDKLAFGDDGVHQRPSHPFIGARLVKATGWIVPPGFNHLYEDTCWEVLTKALGLQVYLPNVKQTHLHFTNGGKFDKTYEQRPRDGAEQFGIFVKNLPSLTKQVMEKLDYYTCHST